MKVSRHSQSKVISGKESFCILGWVGFQDGMGFEKKIFLYTVYQ